MAGVGSISHMHAADPCVILVTQTLVVHIMGEVRDGLGKGNSCVTS